MTDEDFNQTDYVILGGCNRIGRSRPVKSGIICFARARAAIQRHAVTGGTDP